MKKNTMIKMMALAMAFAVAAMPTMSVKACEDCNGHDGCAYESKEHGDQSTDATDGCWTPDSDSSSSSSSNSNDSYSEPSYDYSSSDNGGGSSSSESYDSYDGGSDSYEAPSYDSASASAGGAAVTAAPAAKKSNIVSVPGCQSWRKGSKATEGQFTVTHCGIVRYQLQLIDKDGNAVGYKGAGLLQDETTKLWYINIQTADGTDSTGYGVSTLKGSITYMPELGVTGVMVDGVVVAAGN